MTKEEAIEYLDGMKIVVPVCNELKELADERNEAIDLAIESLSADRPKVAYICDGRKCDKDCSECFRTLDIEHARDFKLLGDTYYQQSSADKFISVVRCKDCKNRVYDESRDYYYCSMFYGQGDVSDDNFCQWGERGEHGK